MNQKDREVLQMEEDFKDTIENELSKNQRKNRNIKVKDIKLVGDATWEDRVNGKLMTEKVFIVEKEIREIDDSGKERITEQKNYYLGDRCIGGALGENKITYNESFKNNEFNKMDAINKLVDETPEEEIESNSLNLLKCEEMSEVLTAHFGKRVSKEDIQQILEKMDKAEIEDLQNEKENNKNKDENDLSKKQTEKVKISGIQKADLNKLVDGKETLGKRLDLEEYESLYVVYSEKVNEITAGTKINNTTYSLVGMTKEGEARVLNNEFKMDNTVGNNGNRQSTKIRANNTATRDNKDVSVYTRKSNGASIGCQNDTGNIDMFLYQKTAEENENIGIQIETSNTPVIPIETREIMNRNKGVYKKEEVQNEIKKHDENNCIADDEKDFDGDETTFSHQHLLENEINDYVKEIFNYENEYGEEKIKEVFTEAEVKDKLLREIEKVKEIDNITIDEVVEKIKEEMNNDAEMLEKEQKGHD